MPPKKVTPLQITGPEALDAAVADVVRLKITHTRLQAARDHELAALEQEQLLAAIWRTEAAFTVASRTLKDLRAKHHRQCAEFVAQASRLSASKLTGKMPVQPLEK